MAYITIEIMDDYNYSVIKTSCRIVCIIQNVLKCIVCLYSSRCADYSYDYRNTVLSKKIKPTYYYSAILYDAS